jgi:hypothetical protein
VRTGGAKGIGNGGLASLYVASKHADTLGPVDHGSESRGRLDSRADSCGSVPSTGVQHDGQMILRVSRHDPDHMSDLPLCRALTESNHRPSPYHPQFRGFTAECRGRWAEASGGQTAAVTCRAAGNVTRRGPGRARRAAEVKRDGRLRSWPVRGAGCRRVTTRPAVRWRSDDHAEGTAEAGTHH